MTSSREHQAHLSRKETIQLFQFMEPLIIVNDAENRLVTYKDGHTDHSIATHFGYTNSQVANLRLEMFGTLVHKTRKPRSKLRELIARMETFEKRFNASLDERDKRLDQLESLVDFLTTKG